MDQASLEALSDEELLKSFYANAVECTIRSKQVKVLISDFCDGVKLSKAVLKDLTKTTGNNWSMLIRSVDIDVRTNPILIETVERFWTKGAFAKWCECSIEVMDVPLGHTIIINECDGVETANVVPLYLV